MCVNLWGKNDTVGILSISYYDFQLETTGKVFLNSYNIKQFFNFLFYLWQHFHQWYKVLWKPYVFKCCYYSLLLLGIPSFPENKVQLLFTHRNYYYYRIRFSQYQFFSQMVTANLYGQSEKNEQTIDSVLINIQLQNLLELPFLDRNI